MATTKNDEEWAKRVCSRNWDAKSQPCAWYRGGQNCNRRWIAFAQPAPYIVMICIMCNTAITIPILFRAYRRDRKNRAILICLVLFAFIEVQAIDINGDFDILPLVVRFGCMKMIRFLVDCALFEVGVKHRIMLGSLSGISLSSFVTRFELVSLQVLTFCFSAFVSSAEILFVPPSGREACLFNLANVTYHLGTASTELLFCAYTLWIAAAARSHIVSQQAVEGGHLNDSFEPASKAVKLITTQLRAIATLFLMIFVFASYMVASHSEPGSLCHQPSCNPGTYVTKTLWLVFYSLGGWLAVFVFTGDQRKLPDLILQVHNARKRNIFPGAFPPPESDPYHLRYEHRDESNDHL